MCAYTYIYTYVYTITWKSFWPDFDFSLICQKRQLKNLERLTLGASALRVKENTAVQSYNIN